MKQKYPKASLSYLCGLFGKSRQSYYQRKEVDYQLQLQQELVLDYVKQIRQQAPGLGCEKLYLMAHSAFSAGLLFGRDAFYRLLRENNLMLKKHKYRMSTTNSRHHYRIYPNLIQGVCATHSNHIWVSDITYILTNEGVCYLSLITDQYSRKILGWHLGPTLEAKYVIKALNMALEGLDKKETPPIHHSDRGSQYCSHLYVSLLNKHHLSISMTQNGDPLENAIAERMNGILKDEWLYRTTCKSIKDAGKKIQSAIWFYNNKRPHRSIDMMTPEKAYLNQGEINRRWKTSYQKREMIC